MEYLVTDEEFLEEWVDKWFSLGDLVWETIRTDKPAAVLFKTSIVQENQYQCLRSWFMENEARFLPLWKRYFQSLDWNLDVNTIIQEINDAEKCGENPFVSFYTIESLDRLLHCISRSRERYPTDEQAWEAAMHLLVLTKLVVSFINSSMEGDDEG